ncbi:hypothetical protein QTO34_003669 [Cnephaeus nilssonii]|uniref:HSF-type DNA-binding domain-containing protein n=1 Tax=Cnephaeus nilssonii TaxID=3371016 RepID=A0AA40HRX6_CNENI|nr:hypothetical protein QTO34_003669 [Eptesicus nilssonii]
MEKPGPSTCSWLQPGRWRSRPPCGPGHQYLWLAVAWETEKPPTLRTWAPVTVAGCGLGDREAAHPVVQMPAPAAGYSMVDGESAHPAVLGTSNCGWLWPGRQRSRPPCSPGLQHLQLQHRRSPLSTIPKGCSQPGLLWLTRGREARILGACGQLEEGILGTRPAKAAFEATVFKIMQMWKAGEGKFEMTHVSSEIQIVSLKDGSNDSETSIRSALCDHTYPGDLELRTLIEESAFQALCEETLIKSPRYSFCASEPDGDYGFHSMTFPRKLWKIVESDQFKSIWWDENGTSVVINEDLFKKEVLERKAPFRIFKTDSMNSLLRQLNLYGFSKIRQNFQTSASLADFLAEEKEVSVLSKELHSGRSEDEDSRLWPESAAKTKMADSGRNLQQRQQTPAGAKAWVPGSGGKLVLEAKGRKTYCTNLFVHRASTVFRQHQFSSGHPPIRAPPASAIGYPERNSDPGGALIGGWPEENWCWRKTAASSHAIGHHQRLPPAPWVLQQRWPNGWWEERESGTRESPPPAPTASQSATLSPAPRASSRPNRGRSGKPRSHRCCSHVLMVLALLSPTDGMEQLGPVPAAGAGEVEKPSGATGVSSHHSHLLTDQE